ncbi:hypothetical protein [Hahella ganghwensis]|uniref:hypothetical protein n=1 Tax=Hahella ganghwensis TaxID=286420 RepID=UPI0003706DAE|nr:hypothetical protein [Hahella ganghwensis]
MNQLKVFFVGVAVLVAVLVGTGYFAGKKLQANAVAFWGDRYDVTEPRIPFNNFLVRWFTPTGGPGINPSFLDSCKVHPATALAPIRESLSKPEQWEALCGEDMDTVVPFSLSDIADGDGEMQKEIREAFKVVMNKGNE